MDLFIDSELMRSAGVLVVFTTRRNGVSSSPYDSLNLAFHVGDSLELVNENRQALASAFGFNPARFTCAKQSHGQNAAQVDNKLIGRGAVAYDTAIDDTDALYTIESQAPLAIFIADCVPIVLVEPKRRIIAVIHAGWRGTIAKIAAKTVKMIIDRFSIRSKNLLAYLGPAIRACSYKVDDDLRQRFRQAFPEAVGDESVLDLPTINMLQLLSMGLETDNMFDLGLCTFCHHDLFYSYRWNQVTGRQAAIAMIY